MEGTRGEVSVSAAADQMKVTNLQARTASVGRTGPEPRVQGEEGHAGVLLLAAAPSGSDAVTEVHPNHLGASRLVPTAVSPDGEAARSRQEASGSGSCYPRAATVARSVAPERQAIHRWRRQRGKACRPTIFARAGNLRRAIDRPARHSDHAGMPILLRTLFIALLALSATPAFAQNAPADASAAATPALTPAQTLAQLRAQLDSIKASVDAKKPDTPLTDLRSSAQDVQRQADQLASRARRPNQSNSPRSASS
ncbi:MAG: hypothetical protein WDW38_007225 [Sanguina aurantia]